MGTSLNVAIAWHDTVDSELVVRTLDGERQAFQQLMLRYSDPLYRHALYMTGSPDAAENILQLSFINAYHQLDEAQQGRFDTWVFRLVADRCHDWLRSIPDSPREATPGDEPYSAELRERVDRALAALPASLREAFVLKHVEGRSYEEMAELLGTTVAALRMRVHRAREALDLLLMQYIEATPRAEIASIWATEQPDEVIADMTAQLGDRSSILDERVAGPFYVRARISARSTADLARYLARDSTRVSVDVTRLISFDGDYSELVLLGRYPSGAMRGLSGHVRDDGDRRFLVLSDPLALIDPDGETTDLPADGLGCALDILILRSACDAD